MADKPIVDERVYAGTVLRDPDTRAVTGIRFQVWLTGGQAAVTIQEAPPSVDLSQLETFRAALAELAAVLSEASRSPERILWHLREQD